MALIIKGRISYTREDGSPLLDLTEYSEEGRTPSLVWKDEEAFLAWVRRRVTELGSHDEEHPGDD